MVLEQHLCAKAFQSIGDSEPDGEGMVPCPLCKATVIALRKRDDSLVFDEHYDPNYIEPFDS